MLAQILFAIALLCGIGFFVFNVKKIKRNIWLGRKINRSDHKRKRWQKTMLIALGQSKMMARPVAGILHITAYLGFFIINIELLEIIIDGLFGSHRAFGFMGGFYDVLIGGFEILAALVLIAVTLFFVRRKLLPIQRFKILKGFPKTDAYLILIIEFFLMLAFLCMNAADFYLHQIQGIDLAGSFPISKYLFSGFKNLNETTLFIIERTAWWFHILGILVFLNYLYYSKHLHILLAFPNVWYSKLQPKGELDNLESVKKEVALMMDPNIDPFSVTPEPSTETFGANDIFDLNRVQLLNAYTCTECGRCSAECPAHLTGKKLSPRKIMMKTRDRLEEVSKNIDKNKEFVPDNKTLLGDYISAEEIWACTSCNACTQACPIEIDPLSIIINLRQYLVMEKSEAPTELNHMMQNIENNGAPWQFNNADRLNWVNDK
ncbi:4Fe-4S dicluster domain-containing protein [Ornithobacterium rhinotracheale]|uniref:4Fe-4S dicluster domain-containing protein n=1 Tax=Ornithobacterium rhinotracheale TaxID=28251 RepID=UPI003FA41F2E